MISIEVDGADALYQVVLPGIMQALNNRVVAVVELNEDGFFVTSGVNIKDSIMEKYREFMDMLAKPDVAIEAAVTAVAREAGVVVIRVKAPARMVWVLYR